MQTYGFFLKSLLESPGNLEICSVKFVDTLVVHGIQFTTTINCNSHV